MDDNHTYAYIERAGRFSWWVHAEEGAERYSHLVPGPKCLAIRILRKIQYSQRKAALARELGKSNEQ